MVTLLVGGISSAPELGRWKWGHIERLWHLPGFPHTRLFPTTGVHMVHHRTLPVMKTGINTIVTTGEIALLLALMGGNGIATSGTNTGASITPCCTLNVMFHVIDYDI